MQVALIKITARRTPRGLVTEKEEILRYLPDESPEEYFETLARILAPEDWDDVENL